MSWFADTFKPYRLVDTAKFNRATGDLDHEMQPSDSGYIVLMPDGIGHYERRWGLPFGPDVVKRPPPAAPPGPPMRGPH